MDVNILKAILLCVLALTTLFFGLIPIKVSRMLKSQSGAFGDMASFIASLLSCFVGGVFLGICFLDIMPETFEAYSNWQEANNFKSEYPIAPLTFMSGFFLVKISEEIIGKFCGSKDEEEVRRKHVATFVQPPSHVEGQSAEQPSISTNSSIIKSLSFVLALTFHASLEGFAFGVQKSELSAASLFFGIFVHKAVVSFSFGMRVIEGNANRLWLPITCVVIVALVTPLGGAAGILIEASKISGPTRDLVTFILLSISIGIFLQFTFYEVLVPEDVKPYNKFAQWFVTVIGFALIGVMMIFE